MADDSRCRSTDLLRGCDAQSWMGPVTRSLIGLLFILLINCSFRPAAASELAPDPMPPKAAELLNLLKDPDVRRWLEQQQQSNAKQPEQSRFVRAGSTVSTRGPLYTVPFGVLGAVKNMSYGIQIRMKMTTRPGEQFSIRRRAYKLIKEAFDANGIKFSVPTVQVAGETSPISAAAARGVLQPIHET